MKYTKNTPRLTVKFINADTEDVLFEVHDRSWMNVGELLSDFYVDNLMKTELKNKKLPKNLLVLVVSEFKLE
jgi:hypothetical protein